MTAPSSEPPRVLRVHDLGHTQFGAAFRHQTALVERRRAGAIPDTLLLTEHAPVVTLGRGARALPPEVLEALARAGLPVVETNRGGAATYHGPGQLVGYPILDLRAHGCDLHAYLDALEDALIGALGRLGCEARSRPGLRGVWVGEAKIAAIGVAVRGWVSYHGFALNVNPDLSPFGLFAPCGLAGVRTTSLEVELQRPASWDDARPAVIAALAEQFGYEHCLKD